VADKLKESSLSSSKLQRWCCHRILDARAEEKGGRFCLLDRIIEASRSGAGDGEKRIEPCSSAVVSFTQHFCVSVLTAAVTGLSGRIHLCVAQDFQLTKLVQCVGNMDRGGLVR
jgi:hypothetical protein